jgi:YHS domain-containing protein
MAPVAADTPQIPAGNHPLGLDGYCPVTLHERQSWQLGDTRWGMQHRGRTYLFAGPQEMERFRQNPDHYSPVMSGHDPVLALEEGKTVPGVCEYGGFYGEHVYLFSSEATYQRFCQNPDRYATQVWQAMRQPTLQR